MASGIYQIENTLNGKCYIGSAVNLKERWQNHLSALRREKHDNSHLQRAFDKYGEDTFIFSVLEDVKEPEKLIEREQFYLDIQCPKYNISSTAGSPLGYRHTEEAIKKMSVASTGKLISVETRAKISVAMTGRHLSTETRAKMSAAKTGERNPSYGKQGRMYGKHHNAETKRKISTAQKAHWCKIRALKSKNSNSSSIKQAEQK